jgi:hypothetical protein
MKPDVDRFLDVAAAYLMIQLAPTVESSYAQSNVNILAMMLMAVREEFDRAAARRVEENREMRRLFREAVAVVADDRLRARLTEAARGGDTSFTLSHLERSNAELRALLIDLHAHVEDLDTPEARRIEAALWSELVASTERRKLAMGPF